MMCGVVPRPDASSVKWARGVLESTFLRGLCAEDDASCIASPRHQHRHQAAEELLSIANGDWRKTTVQHHCRLGCCTSRQDSFGKLWSCVASVIFGRLPAIPALSRWTSCCQTARFFLLGACGCSQRRVRWEFVISVSAAMMCCWQVVSCCCCGCLTACGVRIVKLLKCQVVRLCIARAQQIC